MANSINARIADPFVRDQDTARAGRVLSWVLLVALLPACGPSVPPVDLSPPDDRPVFSVRVADSDEAALLEQELEITPVRLDAGVLLFHASDDQRRELAALGYEPVAVNVGQVFSRVVQVGRRSVEDSLIARGVNLINREDDHWVVRGTLEQLRALVALGYRLAPLGEGEPRLRELRIVVPESADVQRVNAIHVDIYSVEETQQGFVIYGGAFDFQIDQLLELDFVVERISTIGEEDE